LPEALKELFDEILEYPPEPHLDEFVFDQIRKESGGNLPLSFLLLGVPGPMRPSSAAFSASPSSG
jgi:hypothetical protein